jgi:HD-GYP domain-containing protein (c-di-GMP phosphodiesterase class II)
VPGFERVALAVRHEHERFDGSGYPDRIAGAAIPLASRIVLVCDAYHAMTSDRPYRESIGHDLAVAELRRCAGTQFDPVVGDALVSALAERDFDLAVAAPAVGALRLHPAG